MRGDFDIILYDNIQGDSFSVLSSLAKNQNECKKYRTVITSPPYFGYRHYGHDPSEIGQEQTESLFLDKLTKLFTICKKLLLDDGSLWIIIGDTRKNHRKLLIPHRLALKLTESGFVLREDIIWYKKNSVTNSSKYNFSQSYEYILFFSKNERSFTNMNAIRELGNEAREGRNKRPPIEMMQYRPFGQDKKRIAKFTHIVHMANTGATFEQHLPTTNEISYAYGYDPEKYCPTCYRKFKRHATRKRIGGHKHYPIFAACNPKGKNPGNVWEISTKAHYGNEHFAIFPEDLISRIISFATEKNDWVLDPFAGRGTTGIVCAQLGRNFTGIDLYSENVEKANLNIRSIISNENRN